LPDRNYGWRGIENIFPVEALRIGLPPDIFMPEQFLYRAKRENTFLTAV